MVDASALRPICRALLLAVIVHVAIEAATVHHDLSCHIPQCLKSQECRQARPEYNQHQTVKLAQHLGNAMKKSQPHWHNKCLQPSCCTRWQVRCRTALAGTQGTWSTGGALLQGPPMLLPTWTTEGAFLQGPPMLLPTWNAEGALLQGPPQLVCCFHL